MNKAAFFDRDGTINVDVNYLYKIEDFRFIFGVPEFIRLLNKHNYKIIVVTNQSGIARGFYTEEDMHKLNQYMNSELKKIGAQIDEFYYCPHHPMITGECNCRKPKIGLLEKAVRDYDVDIKKSVLFGDRVSDIEAGEKMGIRSFYISDILKFGFNDTGKMLQQIL